MNWTDRTRTINYQKCPRLRWWSNEHGLGTVRGIAPVRVNVPLSTGAATHEGLAGLLSGKSVEEAVGLALAGYDELVLGRGLQLDGNETLEYLYGEQKALCEALVRAYAAFRLPKLLEEFQVVEVEKEDDFPLIQIVGMEPIKWMSRADALLVNRTTGDLEVMSFKTAASWDDRQDAAARHDMQGLSESYAIEQRLKQYAEGRSSSIPRWYYELSKQLGYSPTQVYAVRMEFLLKGERRKNDEGIYVTNSPLIRAYRRENPWPVDPEYAWSYYWYCSEPHSMRKSKWYPTGMCAGDGRKHKISDDFQQFNVWEDERVGGVKGWIEKLSSGAVQPGAGDALAQSFALPVPFFRQEADMRRWQTQVRVQETQVAAASRLVRLSKDQEELEQRLDEFFPMHTHVCDWPTRCPYQELCFGTCPRLDEIPDLFMRRKPHHEPEAREAE